MDICKVRYDEYLHISNIYSTINYLFKLYEDTKLMFDDMLFDCLDPSWNVEAKNI